MRVKAVLFDKDGTLFDFQKTWSGWIFEEIRLLSNGDDALAQALAQALDFDMSSKRILPGSVVIAGTALDSARVIQRFVPELSVEEIASAGNARAALVTPVSVLPLKPFLTELMDLGLSLGVATNDAEASARRQLDGLEITGMFDYFVGYDSGFGAKPDPGMCAGFTQQLGHDPQEIVMVGDSLHDLHAGRAAGMRTVGVLTGPARREDLHDHADVVLDDISGLKGWITAS